MEPTENIVNYKFGIFYYNKADQRFVVPKMNKSLGWTFNFAHPRSYIVMAAMVVIVPALTYLLLWM